MKPDDKTTKAITIAKSAVSTILVIITIFALSGCAATQGVTSRERVAYYRLPRPNNILVYNFAASPAEVPLDSTFAGQRSAPATMPTAQQVALGRQLGAAIAAQLVNDIRGAGLPATQVTASTPVLRVNDIVVRGYLVSVDPGSTVQRMTIGFGSGGSQLTTAVECYQMTVTGLRRLGSGTVGADGGTNPGASLGAAGLIVTGSPVGLIVGGGMQVYGEASGSATIEGRAKATADEIFTVFKGRFQEEGWVN